MKAALEPEAPETKRLWMANLLLRDYDRLFGIYVRGTNMEEEARKAGVRMREPGTVIEAWLLRVKKEPGEEGAKEEFKRGMESNHSGGERYVEWVREDRCVHVPLRYYGGLEEQKERDPRI